MKLMQNKHYYKRLMSPCSTEHYHLQHNNHLMTVLSALAQDEVFVDVTLTAQGHSVKAHKVTSIIFTHFK